MATAEEVAMALAYEFLRDGRFTQSIGPTEVPYLASAVAAGDGEEIVQEHSSASFGNIAVQSVGFEEGIEDPKVHLYLTRGTNRLIKSLPTEMRGVTIQAHKMGVLNVRPEAAASATNHGHFYSLNNRVCCGSSCAPTSENSTGTLGALVRRHGSPELYLLSNNHVFGGCNHVPHNQPILSPSSNDGKPSIPAPREIGRHEMIHELRSGDPIFVNPCDTDLALARAPDPKALSSWQGDSQDGYDTSVQVMSPSSRMKVKKFGRTTGLSHGFVQAKISAPMAVGYNSKLFKGTIWFKEVWTVKSRTSDPFALSGDSGSLVVSDDNQVAIGILFAANNTGEYGWIIPMPCVMNAFGGLKLVRQHGV
jgi:hypothetical protein